MDQSVDNLEKDKKHLIGQLEEKGTEINKLNVRITEQDQELGEKLMEIVQLESAIDDLRDQLEEVWISYHNDREWWKQRADKVLGWVFMRGPIIRILRQLGDTAILIPRVRDPFGQHQGILDSGGDK